MDTHEQLIRAVHTATRKLASTGKFDDLLREVLVIAVEAVGASGGTIYIHDPVKKRLVFRHVLPQDVASRMPFKDIPDDAGVAGQVFQTRKIQVSEFTDSKEKTRKDVETATGVVTRTMVTVPLMMENEEPIGVVQLINKLDGSFSQLDMEVLDTVAAVSTMAYLNSRLIDESTRASTLLGMGKVSHDIGHLAASLLATLSFSEYSINSLRKEMKRKLDEKSVGLYLDTLQEMYRELKSSVERIVGYSRLISDLSAGRALSPKKVLAPLSDTIRTSAEFLESDARKNHVIIRYDIQQDAPPLLHDELYLFRITQNLVGNAIRAIKETIPHELEEKYAQDDETVFGEVVVRYHFEENCHLLEVHDSGPGMTEDSAERILSGNARSEWDKTTGSGWGTKIVLELAATHNARVTIDSQPGLGATFIVRFPGEPMAVLDSRSH